MHPPLEEKKKKRGRKGLPIGRGKEGEKGKEKVKGTEKKGEKGWEGEIENLDS